VSGGALRLKVRISLVVVVVLVSGAAIRGWDLARRHHELLAEGAARAGNLALLLSGYLRESFAAADASLRQLALHSQRIGGPAAPDSQWLPSLGSAGAGLPAVAAVSVVDTAGVIRHSTQPLIVGQSRRGDYLFRALAKDTADVLIASRPFRTVAGRPGFIIPLGRRLADPAGRFTGIIVASFALDSVRRFFREADVGRGGMAWVFHPDGIILIREPSDTNPIGEGVAGNPIFKAAAAAPAAGTVRARLMPDGPILITGLRRLQDPVLTVAVSLSEPELLAPWWREVELSMAAFVFLALVLAGALALLFRQMDTRQAAEAALARGQRLALLGQFTGGVAHDFNNLLTVILGNTSLLKMEGGGTEAVVQIEQAALRAADLTRNLLAFARRQPLHPALEDLNRLVESVRPMLRRLLGEDVALTVRLTEVPCLAVVDATQLETALVNLCVNARDAMRQGGLLVIETSRTELTPEYARQQEEVAPGPYSVVAVSDTGEGIVPENLTRVFDPFFTTKEVGKGTGLGLSMVYGFVKQSGGHVKAYSEPGHGATFKLYFPAATGRVVEPAPPADAAERGDGEVILLVEDEPPVRSLARRLLEDLGYTVRAAHDGQSALALARTLPRIDLLLTDVMLPGGMSGRDVAETLLQERPGTPVVYTSGYSEEILSHRAHVGPDPRLVSKPYDRQQLAAAVRAGLRDRPSDGAG
jgi:signal transduction histidine kinase/ActR/RegA family two-component response regulator